MDEIADLMKSNLPAGILKANNMATAALASPVFRFRFRNPGKSALHLWIEPLGDRVTIPGGTTVEVRCAEQLGQPSEFEISNDGITVHGWVQSILGVTKDGELKPLWILP
jgi:hypothetical protein